MKKSVQWIFFGLLTACLCPRTSAINCLTGLLDACTRCFVDRGLEVTYLPNVRDPSVLQQALLLTGIDPLVQCRAPELYKEAMACMIDLIEYCSAPGLEIRLPDTRLMKKGMDLMCSKYRNVNAECMKANNNRVVGCTDVAVKEYMSNLDDEATRDFTELTCMMADVNYDCTFRILGTACDALTFKAYLEMHRFYLIPRACTAPERDPGRADRTIYVSRPDVTSLAPVPTQAVRSPLFAVRLLLCALAPATLTALL